jgi:hypothetical protein
MTLQQFTDILLEKGIVPQAAIEDPEGFDSYYTVDSVRLAYEAVMLAMGEDTERKAVT